MHWVNVELQEQNRQRVFLVLELVLAQHTTQLFETIVPTLHVDLNCKSPDRQRFTCAQTDQSWHC